jgi:hypothetical protein
LLPVEADTLVLGRLLEHQSKQDAQKDARSGRALPKRREYTRQKAREWARERE